MKVNLLQKHINHYQKEKASSPEQFDQDWSDRQEHVNKYQSYRRERIAAMDEEELYEYISPLWAMMIWGNKRYVVDKLIEDNSLEKLKEELTRLL